MADEISKIENMLLKEDLSAQNYMKLSRRLEEVRRAKIKASLERMGADLIKYCNDNELSLKTGMRIAGLGEGLRKAPIKYRDPLNNSNMWAGRGRTPLWYKKRIEEGYTEADLKEVGEANE
ncbi:MAG: H-NS family nucleoid-associated regulatory protein [Moraxellaceae bacterium]